MSSLYDQLTNSGGVESGTKSKSTPTTSYYHNNKSQSNLSRFEQEKARIRKDWTEAGVVRPRSRKSQEKSQSNREVYDSTTGEFLILKTDRPYAYQPAKEGVGPPSPKSILVDFMIFAAETMLAAFGHALMEFFLYSRFRPSIGVKY